MTKPTRREGALLPIRVQPRAQQDAVVGWQGATLRVSVTAPPTDGRANQAVIALLSETLRVPRASIDLVSGARSRDKLIRISQHSLAEIHALLAGARA
ncbi:MAG TPA: DUF167 domain-containing protein [Candidatus Methylomirabilis sp.]|nr:DUF167 domain-containing protein [Candidatus Methylomirabilis sp.]